MIASENASDHRSLKSIGLRNMIAGENASDHRSLKIGLRNMIAGENASDHRSLKDFLGFISLGFLFRLFLEILYVSSDIFSGINLITKQNFHRVTIKFLG